MYCGYCGSKLKDDAKFCGHCGKPAKKPSTSPAPFPASDRPSAPSGVALPGSVGPNTVTSGVGPAVGPNDVASDDVSAGRGPDAVPSAKAAAPEPAAPVRPADGVGILGKVTGKVGDKMGAAIAGAAEGPASLSGADRKRFAGLSKTAGGANAPIPAEDLRTFLIGVAVAVVVFVLCAVAAVTYHNGLWGNASDGEWETSTVAIMEYGIADEDVVD